MDHQHLPHRLSLGKAQRQTAKIILHFIIIFPPGILIVENRWIVPLPASSNRIQCKVLTTSCNSKGELPISQPFLGGKIQLPASAAISLTDGHGAVILMRHTCTLLHSQVLIRLCAKKVNSWIMQITKLWHGSAAHTGLIAQVVLIQNMSCGTKSSFITPLINLLHIALFKSLGHGLPIIVTDFCRSLSIKKQVRQLLLWIVSPFPNEILRKSNAPRNPWPALMEHAEEVTAVRLICKKAFHLFWKRTAQNLFIMLMCQFQKCLYTLWIQIIRRH